MRTNKAVFDSDDESLQELGALTVLVNGQHKVAKPWNVFVRERFAAAWLVLRGKACAVRWYTIRK